jgi:hypothetical protein
MTGMDFVITVVHGTWAASSELAQERSPFSEALSKSLDCTAVFCPFKWSGDNSHSARINATRDLRAHIAHLAVVHPEAAQFIIAHSHGGNIAVWATRDPKCGSRVAGLITLSTPFLHVCTRVLDVRTVRAMKATLRVIQSPRSLLTAIYFAVLGGLFFLAFVPYDFDLPSEPGAVLASVVTGVVFYYLEKSTLHYTRPLEEYIVEDLRTFSRPGGSTPLLLVRAPADEASYALSAAAFLNWIIFRLSYQLPHRAEKVRRLLDRHKRLPLALMLMWLLTGALAHLMDKWAPIQAVLWVIAAAWGVIILLVLFEASTPTIFGVMFMPIAYLLGLVNRTFGSDIGASTSAMYEISAESTPEGGPHEVYVLGDSIVQRRLKSFTGSEWMHSETYLDPAAIDEMTRWIKSHHRVNAADSALS